jgi:hypothetical protein
MSSVNGYVKYKGDKEKEERALTMSRSRRNDTTRYVYACAVFASLNSVLLGYGSIFFIKSYSVINGFSSNSIKLGTCSYPASFFPEQNMLWDGTDFRTLGSYS